MSAASGIQEALAIVDADRVPPLIRISRVREETEEELLGFAPCPVVERTSLRDEPRTEVLERIVATSTERQVGDAPEIPPIQRVHRIVPQRDELLRLIDPEALEPFDERVGVAVHVDTSWACRVDHLPEAIGIHTLKLLRRYSRVDRSFDSAGRGRRSRHMVWVIRMFISEKPRSRTGTSSAQSLGALPGPPGQKA